MKVMTVLGTRPEIIRLSVVIEQLDRHAEHVLVHTGQNFDVRLNELFFEELGVRAPDVNLGVRGASFGEQIGQLLQRIESAILQYRPDRFLILGDTNSGLSALIARRMGIPVFHMEAGNRCFDDRVPEEVNRRVIDHSSSVLMPYTNRSRDNLLREGIASDRIYVTGNPIKQVLDRHSERTGQSQVLAHLGLEKEHFFLVTLHRAENVDVETRLRALATTFDQLAREFHMPVVCSLHPRTREKMKTFGVGSAEQQVRFVDPLGLFDFVALEQSAFCVLTDSGTVQEEACIFRTPVVTIRDVTERPETVECGSNILSGCDPMMIVDCVKQVTAAGAAWTPPAEYLATNVAETVCRIVLGFRLPDRAEEQWQASKRERT